MANVDAPNGFTPVNVDGSPWSGTLKQYDVDSAYANDIFIGSLVAQAADGNIQLATAGAGNRILGAVVGFLPHTVDDFGVSGSHDNINLQNLYSPASTAQKVLVALADDDTYFVAQEDSVGGALTSTERGARVNFIGTSGSTTTGRSTSELDSSTAGTGATLQFQLVDIVKAADNGYGTNARWIVKCNLPQHSSDTAGI